MTATAPAVTYGYLSALVQLLPPHVSPRALIQHFRRALLSEQFEACYATGRFRVPGDVRRAREMIYANTPAFQAWYAQVLLRLTRPRKLGRWQQLAHLTEQSMLQTASLLRESPLPAAQSLTTLPLESTAQLVRSLLIPGDSAPPLANLLGGEAADIAQPLPVALALATELQGLVTRSLLLPPRSSEELTAEYQAIQAKVLDAYRYTERRGKGV